ncbi:MAG: phosphatase PAP2 family protein [Candidatus Kapabacteria bacterium]|nr:phosphatase PAP2 family protein [Candidatus Kapabacteria bacterium]
MRGVLAFAIAGTMCTAADTTQTLLQTVWDELCQTPSNLTREPVPTVAATTSVVAIVLWLSGADKAVREAARTHRSPTADALAQIGNTAGGLGPATALPLALIVGGSIANSSHTVTSGRQLLQALAVAGAVTTALKVAVGRARPFRNRGDSYLLPFRWNDDQWSFPSGHATVAGTIAGVAFARSNSTVLHVAASALALTIMGARVYSDKHWTSDVLMGATVGGCIGYALARVPPLWRRCHLLPSSSGIQVAVEW